MCKRRRDPPSTPIVEGEFPKCSYITSVALPYYMPGHTRGGQRPAPALAKSVVVAHHLPPGRAAWVPGVQVLLFLKQDLIKNMPVTCRHTRTSSFRSSPWTASTTAMGSCTNPSRLIHFWTPALKGLSHPSRSSKRMVAPQYPRHFSPSGRRRIFIGMCL